jgi:diaminohydroxyphosphoribosylaminopyrimidine deaminase/5-amino-6-(5-phosphoribosylamino)uracil reductase
MKTLPDAAFSQGPIKVGQSISPEEAMDYCFDIARHGVGKVSPNPLVGCVIVDAEHRFISAGYHGRYGEAHAEQEAMNSVDKSKLKNATVYVSLEPCAHHGHTPPCAVKLAELPLKEVIYAIADPNPKVNGKGAEILRLAGIKCRLLEGYEDKAWEQNAFFFMRQEKEKSLVVGLKVGMTLDAKIANPGDERRWITNSRSRQLSHYLRLVYDAICIGARTVVADNPSLNPRETSFGDRMPWRVVLDPTLVALKERPLEGLNLLRAEPEKVIWLTARENRDSKLVEKLSSLGVCVRFLEVDKSMQFSAVQIVDAVEDFPIYSMMIEGGSSLYHCFLESGLLDRLHVFMSVGKLYGTGGLPLYPGFSEINLEPRRLSSYEIDKDMFFDIIL